MMFHFKKTTKTADYWVTSDLSKNKKAKRDFNNSVCATRTSELRSIGCDSIQDCNPLKFHVRFRDRFRG